MRYDLALTVVPHFLAGRVVSRVDVDVVGLDGIALIDREVGATFIAL